MRTLGGLGISVGTSLSFETELIGPTLRKSDSVLVNLRTLIRNAREAFEDKEESSDVDLVTNAVEEDIAKLTKFIMDQQGNRSLNFILYYPSYKSLNKEFAKAELWVPTTDKQILESQLNTKVSERILKRYGKLIIQNDCRLPEFAGTGIIMTHHPVDLVLTNSVTRLFLLESHTGNLKPYTKWYTKLTGKDEDLFNIPLNKLTIQVFGDKSTNFKSSTAGIKSLVKQLAVDAKWTSATTLDRVKSSINNHTAGVDRAGLLLLLK